MPRFVYKPSGSLVECSDEVAATLSSDYEPAPEVEQPAPEVEQPRPTRATAKK